MRKEESVVLQRLVLLLGLLREAGRRAGRMAGEQLFDENARHHAGAEGINRIVANAIDEAHESYSQNSPHA
jgi:hypothetical protein